MNGLMMEKRMKSVEDIVSDSSSDDSSVVSRSSSDQSSTHGNVESDSHKASFAHDETKMVNRSKAVVYLVLLLAAAGVGIGTFFILRNSEEKNFASQVSKPMVCFKNWIP